MNISQPVASCIGSVDFDFLFSEEIRALSVKQINNATTYDSLLNAVPGGLYDSALGARADNLYAFDLTQFIFPLIACTLGAQPAT